MMEAVKIRVDDLSSPQVIAFLEEHLSDMRAASPPESVHALDVDELKKPDITFWVLWQGENVLASGALKQLSPEHAEIKSMRTSGSKRGQGLGAVMLDHIIRQAQLKGYKRLSLETGSMDFFRPATTLYKRYGFEECEPFACYVEDPNSVFLTRLLDRP